MQIALWYCHVYWYMYLFTWQKTKAPKFSLHGLGEKTHELEHEQAMSPIGKYSTDSYMASGGEEEGAGTQEEAMSAQNSSHDSGSSKEKEKPEQEGTPAEEEILSAQNSPLDTTISEEGKCEQNTDKFEGRLFDVQRNPALIEDNKNTGEQVDEMEGASAMQ